MPPFKRITGFIGETLTGQVDGAALPEPSGGDILRHMSEERVDRETAELYLKNVEPLWRAFWFHMHLMARNIEEFAAGLDTISDEVFAYHVSGQKNDFSRWIQEVIGDASLARALGTVRTKEEAASIVQERLAELQHAVGRL